MDENKESSRMYDQAVRFFNCTLHGRRIIACQSQGAFVLECGCAYRYDDWRGIQFINTTSECMPDGTSIPDTWRAITPLLKE